MKKRVALWMCFLIISVFFIGCGKEIDNQGIAENEAESENKKSTKKENVEEEKRVIGVSILTRGHVFWNTVAESIEVAGEEAGVEVIVVDAQQDSNVQYAQIQDFITQGVDGIIMSPASTAGSAAAMKLTEDAGIPVVTLFIKSDGEPIAYIGTDEIKGGNLAGEVAVDVLGEAGNCVIITYDEIEQCVDRAEGFKQILEKYPDMHVLQESNYSGDTDKAASATQDFITQYPDLDLIFAVGDPAAVGAVNTIKAAGLDIKVIGYDGNPEAIEGIKQDTDLWVADIAQDPVGAGKGSVATMLDYLNGEEVISEFLIEPYIIDMGYIEDNGL